MHLAVESAQLKEFFPNCSLKLIVLLCLSTFDQNFLKGTVCRKLRYKLVENLTFAHQLSSTFRAQRMICVRIYWMMMGMIIMVMWIYFKPANSRTKGLT